MIKLLLKSLHFTSNSLELIPESFYRFGMSAQTIANLRQDTRIVQLLGTWTDKMFKSACLIFNWDFVLVSIARTHSQVEPQPLRLQNLLRPLPGRWIKPSTLLCNIPVIWVVISSNWATNLIIP